MLNQIATRLCAVLARCIILRCTQLPVFREYGEPKQQQPADALVRMRGRLAGALH